MHIILAKTFNEAPCLIHFITDISITGDAITATVNSHASIGGRLFWQEKINIPSSRLTGNPRDAVLAYLVEPGQYLAGGVIGSIATETNAAAELRMMTVIDEEREARMMNELTAGGAKKYEYSAKLREWQDFNTLGVSAALLLPLIDQKARWPWAMAEVADSGDNLQTVMARFKSGIDKSAVARKIAARAQTLKRQMRAATTFAARKAIFDARTWPVS
jgi:hypothetical protein